MVTTPTFPNVSTRAERLFGQEGGEDSEEEVENPSDRAKSKVELNSATNRIHNAGIAQCTHVINPPPTRI
jgi:hypothetical protein